jgi:hypothetical protein
MHDDNGLTDPTHEKMHDGNIQRTHLEEKWMMAMVSRTHLVDKTLDSNGLTNHPTDPYRGKIIDDNSLTYPS